MRPNRARLSASMGLAAVLAVAGTVGLFMPTAAVAQGDSLTYAPIISAFTLDNEGWEVVGDSTSLHPTWVSPGFIRTVDQVGGGTMYWSAPKRFLGYRDAWFGGHLRFELRQSNTDNQYDAADVILIGSDGTALGFDTQGNPGTGFTPYDVVLNDDSGRWTVMGPNPRPATDKDIANVLSGLIALRIRAEFRSGPDTDDLDNVVFMPGAILPA
jgi:alkaline phosphatase D